jgi:hypothetical protein
MDQEKVLCKVCSLGTIEISIERNFEVRARSFWEWLSRKKPRKTEWTTAKIHCNTCGVKYEFMPAKYLVQPKPNQIRPNLFRLPKSVSIFAPKSR